MTVHAVGVVDTSIIAALRLFASSELPDMMLITAVTLGELSFGPHATDDPVMQSLHKTLTENGVRLTIRRGILRVAMHLYNNEDDVDGFLDVVRLWREKRAA